MRFHKEGYTSLALCILFIFVINALLQFYAPDKTTLKWLAYILSSLFFVAVVFFFRSPSVTIIANEKDVLSPADGKVVEIKEIEETAFLKDKRILVSIAISPLNVHVNRNPIKGLVKYFSAVPNGGTTIAVENLKGTVIVYRQVKGFSVSRIVDYIKQGDTVEQGAEFGFSKLGSRIDVYLPLNSNISVDIDDAVTAGKTVLATLKA